MRYVKLLIAAVPLVVFGQKFKGDTFRVFYLGGQSNMDGYGWNSELPDSLKLNSKDYWIFHGNPVADGNKTGGNGHWSKLKSGHGVGFSYDRKKNKYSNRFGVELSFAKKIKQLYPNEKIAIIKYSKGGSSIDSLSVNGLSSGIWEPDMNSKINQYDYFLRTVRGALSVSDINGDGNSDKLIFSGILWMQGESDAAEEAIAKRYYDNLKRLTDLIRAAFRVDDLPLVIGKISDSGQNKSGKVWPYCELVQYAQEKLARTNKNTSIVRSTKYYKYSDPAHYDSQAYIHFGVEFAKEIYKEHFE